MRIGNITEHDVGSFVVGLNAQRFSLSEARREMLGMKANNIIVNRATMTQDQAE